MIECRSCKFWHKDYDDTGQCRRHCPTCIFDALAPDALSVWPMTASSDWCGEYQLYNQESD